MSNRCGLIIGFWLFSILLYCGMRTSPDGGRPEAAIEVTDDIKKNPIIVVVVFPSTVDRDRNSKRIEIIKKTWGEQRNDNFHVLNIGFEIILPDELKDKHQGSTDVIKHCIEESLKRFPNMHYWVKADDLTYILRNNMIQYLSTRQSDYPELLGRRLQLGGKGEIFCSGGAGYAVSRSAINFLMKNWCYGQGWYRKEAGDIAMSSCLHNYNKSSIIDTRDSKQRDRFHAYGPKRQITGLVDQWYKEYTPWYNITEGLDCCSPNTVSFHYIEYGEAEALYKIITTEKRTIASMIDSERLALYPNKPPGLSGYSRKPSQNDLMWKLLLEHIQ